MTATDTTSFIEIRDAIVERLKETSKKIQTMSFPEALTEYKNLFQALIKEYGLDAKLLKTRGTDEPHEGQPGLNHCFQQIPADLASAFMKNWEKSTDAEEFFRYFNEFDKLWNALGSEMRKTISSSWDVCERFFARCTGVDNIKETQRFLAGLNLLQLFEIKKFLNGEYYTLLINECLDKEFKLLNLSQAYNLLNSSGFSAREKELLCRHLVTREDFKKISPNVMMDWIKMTRSVVLVEAFLERNDLPVEFFILKVAMNQTR